MGCPLKMQHRLYWQHQGFLSPSLQNDIFTTKITNLPTNQLPTNATTPPNTSQPLTSNALDINANDTDTDKDTGEPINKCS